MKGQLTLSHLHPGRGQCSPDAALLPRRPDGRSLHRHVPLTLVTDGALALGAAGRHLGAEQEDTVQGLMTWLGLPPWLGDSPLVAWRVEYRGLAG